LLHFTLNFRKGFLYKNLSDEFDLTIKYVNKSHILLKGVNEVLPLISTFSLDLDNIRYIRWHKKFLLTEFN
jgi:hypothetical protein